MSVIASTATPPSLFTYPVLFEKCARMAALTSDALCRVDAKRDMNILGISNSEEITRTPVRADFRKAVNLRLFDDHVYHRVMELMEEAMKRDMTGATRLFGEEGLYALRELGGVGKKGMVEIAHILHPQPSVQLGRVLAFAPRTA